MVICGKMALIFINVPMKKIINQFDTKIGLILYMKYNKCEMSLQEFNLYRNLFNLINNITLITFYL